MNWLQNWNEKNILDWMSGKGPIAKVYPIPDANNPNPGWFSDVAWASIKSLYDAHEHAFEFGPGHIVFADPNLDDGCIDFCINECDNPEYLERDSKEDIEAVRRALTILRAIPEDDRWSDWYKLQLKPKYSH